jgi:hypothetical protein
MVHYPLLHTPSWRAQRQIYLYHHSCFSSLVSCLLDLKEKEKSSFTVTKCNEENCVFVFNPSCLIQLMAHWLRIEGSKKFHLHLASLCTTFWPVTAVYKCLKVLINLTHFKPFLIQLSTSSLGNPAHNVALIRSYASRASRFNNQIQMQLLDSLGIWF